MAAIATVDSLCCPTRGCTDSTLQNHCKHIIFMRLTSKPAHKFHGESSRKEHNASCLQREIITASFQMEHTWLARPPFTDYTWPAVEHAGWLHTCVDERRFFPSVPQQTCSVGALEVSPLEAVTHKHCVFSKHTCHTGARRVRQYADPHLLRTSKTVSQVYYHHCLFVCITTSIVSYKSLNRGSF